MADRIYSVYEINTLVKQSIEENELFKDLFLEGELSNITYYKSGHLYFTLKDNKASIKCVCFHYKYKKISTTLQVGDQVKLFGRLTLYEANGQYQFLVSHLEKSDDIGVLFKQLEKIKLELSEKGWFDEISKKELPFLPQNIGIVTSGTGAAVRDIIETAKKRYPNINIYIYPAKVQGEGADVEVAEGIKSLNKIKDIDLIIAGRGGGSIEDLWSFNTLTTATAFYKSKKPIISAVGHETDVLLTDFVADKRAATPTQAVEIGIPVKEDLKSRLLEKKRILNNLILSKLEREKRNLKGIRESYTLRRFPMELEAKNNLLMEKEERLNRELMKLFSKKEEALKSRIDKLHLINPDNILRKGYTITKFNNKIMNSSINLEEGNLIETVFHDGKILSKIEEKK